MLRRQLRNDACKFAHRIAMVKKIAYHLIHVALPRKLAQQGTYVVFMSMHGCSQLPHPGRIEAPFHD